MIKIHAPTSHPRYLSNYYRDLLVEGVSQGITSTHGLIAHGRGEMFDYVLGEKTHAFARTSIQVAAATLLLAKKPVISVNGNTAVLVPKELTTLSNLLNAHLEINIFHASPERERKIAEHLTKNGATSVLLPDSGRLDSIESNRKFVSARGQEEADVVFVPLEDGDRAQALINMGKKVIVIDLNPLSRSAQAATITTVDNLVRALPLLIEEVKKYKASTDPELTKIVKTYDNKHVLSEAIREINHYLSHLSKSE